MPNNPEPLLKDQFYHIYNRGNNRETLFREERNYGYFLRLYAKYIPPVAETYAYCLLGNHFHLLVRIKDWQSYHDPSHAFANLFSTYTKAINKAYQRTGSLFEKPFQRKRVDSEHYLTSLVVYIHRNPQAHGLIDDYRLWPYSSYGVVDSDKTTILQCQAVLDWFGGDQGYRSTHNTTLDQAIIERVVIED